MLSRIADSLFWMNRYMERADGMLRSIKAYYILSLDKSMDDQQSWRPVLEIFAHTPEDQIQLMTNDTEAVLQQLIVDAQNTNSLKQIVTKARENARGVQDHITKEVWEQVNQMYHLANHPTLSARLRSYNALDVIDNLTRHSLLYTGVVDSTMSRGMGWNFMNLGRFIERCLQTIQLAEKQFAQIDYNLYPNRDIIQWRCLLLSVAGYEMHLKKYRTNQYNQNVLHHLIINPDFTRSLVYCLSRIDKYLHDITQENPSDENKALVRFFGRMYSNVRYIELNGLNELTLQQFFDTTKRDLIDFSRMLGQCFFSYA